MPIKGEHMKKTAFIALHGKYGYNIAFGVDHCTVDFPEAKGQGLQGLHQFSEEYLDDILIHSLT